MLCLPVFIILLLLVSPAATLPVESDLQRDLTQVSSKDFGMRTELKLKRRLQRPTCCGRGICCKWPKSSTV
uniref:Conotoxin n=1 Tax=Conus praecellens TaxID=128530 RepID=A0A291C303_CONPC|nr:conotoxin [Conus praecellens]